MGPEGLAAEHQRIAVAFAQLGDGFVSVRTRDDRSLVAPGACVVGGQSVRHHGDRDAVGVPFGDVAIRWVGVGVVDLLRPAVTARPAHTAAPRAPSTDTPAGSHRGMCEPRLTGEQHAQSGEGATPRPKGKSERQGEASAGETKRAPRSYDMATLLAIIDELIG